MFEMYKSKKKKMSEDQYALLKKYYLDEGSMGIDYKLVREVIFSKTREFTIRMEQMNFDEIYVVKKSKWNGITYESSNKITEQECRDLLKGNISWMENQERPLVNNLFLQMKYNKARPKLIKECMEETCIQKNSKEKAVFTYGTACSKTNVEGFLDYDIELGHISYGILADVQTEIQTPSFLLQLV